MKIVTIRGLKFAYILKFKYTQLFFNTRDTLLRNSCKNISCTKMYVGKKKESKKYDNAKK